MFEEVASGLPREICREFRIALMVGHWKNGMKLTNKQRLTCERALFINEDLKPGIIH